MLLCEFSEVWDDSLCGKLTNSFVHCCFVTSPWLVCSSPSELTGGEAPPSAVPAQTVTYWLNFASFVLFLVGNCASIAAWLVILHKFVKVRPFRVTNNAPRYTGQRSTAVVIVYPQATLKLQLRIRF